MVTTSLLMAVELLSTFCPNSSSQAPRPTVAGRERFAASAIPESRCVKSAMNPPVATPLFAITTNALPSLEIPSAVTFPSNTLSIFPSDVVIASASPNSSPSVTTSLSISFVNAAMSFFATPSLPEMIAMSSNPWRDVRVSIAPSSL